ncbi:MAG: cellulose biosynthesis cyclic di-GMP-binding regulatory protein BcsB [Deltaproteobacteria bacterium]|nr:cellulose biosynthesis cyclic di-GMP-binding regulatory protein BcsB [Deltaproteobacteria bacterium]
MRSSIFSLVVLAVLLGASPASAQEAERPYPGPEGAYEATFEDEFFQSSDLMLQGVHANASLTFTRPKSWELVADPVLHVAFNHSAALLEHRSHLTVLVNDHPIGTVALSAANATGGEFDLSLPRKLLDDYNLLAFAVQQHYTDDCEDPFDPALWTRIERVSSITLPYRRLPVVGELLEWPFPVFDKLGYGPTRLALVTAGSPSPDTVDALGKVGFSVGRLADWREVDSAAPVTTVLDARTPAAVIGTVSEAPEALGLLGLDALADDEGAVGIVPNPSDPTLPVLVVVGGGPAGLAKAAGALAGQDRHQVLSGSVSRVTALGSANPPPTRMDPLPVPPATKFDFGDIGVQGVTVRGYYPPTIRVPLRFEGDALVTPGGGTARIDYAYSAQLDPRLSSMEIRLGGLVIRSVPLDKVAGESSASVTAPLPQELFAPESTIDIVFHLFPRDFDACERVSDKQLWGTVFASSSLDLARDHVAEMPDLELLRFGNWPFTGLAPQGGTVVVLPDAPSARATSAGFTYATRLGRLTHAPAPDFRLARAGDAGFSENAEKHFVLLVEDAGHALYDSMASAGQVLLTGGPDRLLSNSQQAALVRAAVGTPYGTVEETFSPANPERGVLVLRALREDGLETLVDVVTDLGKVKLLDGNAAVVADDLSVRTIDVATRARWGSLPVTTAAQREIQRNWWVLGALVLGGAFILTAIVRVWAQSRPGPG